MVLYAMYGVGGMEGHVSRDCTMEQKAKSCYRCGREGHIVRYFISYFPCPVRALSVSYEHSRINGLLVQFGIAVA
jgi:Zinc knuckle